MTAPILTNPDWALGMFEHFHQTGAYRAEDIQRVLGDPNEGVILRSAPHVEAAYRASDPTK